MMNYFKKILIVVGIIVSFFITLTSIALAGGTCSAVSPTSVKFELTGCPNIFPSHGALRWCQGFWWNCVEPVPYTFCNGPQFKTVLPGSSAGYQGYDSNNTNYASCSYKTPGGRVRIGTNVSIGAPWTVSSANGFFQTGTGSLVIFDNQLPGSYTVVWGNVAGYTKTVTTQTLTLTSGLISSNDLISFNNTYTLAPATIPTLNLPTASSITTSSAILGANIISNGGASITVRGTCWGLTSTTATNCVSAGGTTTGAFSHLRTGMSAGTTIYYRGYATNSAGTGYSSVSSFNTLVGATVPTLMVLPATSITTSSALLGFSFSNTGGAPITAKGLCWGFVINPTTNCNDYGPGSGAPGEWGGVITGMPSGTLIYFRAYGTNSAGTGYSATASFTTLGVPVVVPTLTSPTVTSITTSSAILGANITSNGGAPIIERGICWGTTTNPTTNCVPQGGTTTGIFTHLRTGLPTGAYIYYRGYATNSAGTGYSSSGAFTVLWLDLTAGTAAPPNAIAGVPATFTSTISKNGTTGTGTSFNTLFQFDDNDHTTVFASQSVSTPAINTIPSGTALASVLYTFPSATPWFVRACADNNTAFVGTITELPPLGENNNCGAWTPVMVSGISGTLNAPNCLISSGASTCTSNVSWSITNPVAPNSVRQNGVSFSTASSGSALRTISYSGPNTFTLYSNNGATLLTTISPTTSCTTGTTWNGSVCAVIPAFTCTGATPTNATIYGGDETGLSANTSKTYSITNTAPKCQFSCNSGTSWNGTSCVASSCGDNLCNGIETLLTCPRDCKGKVQQF